MYIIYRRGYDIYSIDSCFYASYQEHFKKGSDSDIYETVSFDVLLTHPCQEIRKFSQNWKKELFEPYEQIKNCHKSY